MFGQNQDDQQLAAPPVEDIPITAPIFNSSGAIPQPLTTRDSDGTVVTPDITSALQQPPVMQSAPPVQDNVMNTADDLAQSLPPLPVVPLVPPAPAENDDLTINLPTNPADDMQVLKQKALQSLTPIVNKLEQSPEEKFRTTMMMIQASDNKDLLPQAYAAAQGISDERAKAQALLDVINEINYFSQAN
jgi:hypothetical protein